MRLHLKILSCSLVTTLVMTSLTSVAFAQRAFDCNSEDAKKQAIRGIAKLRGKSDPYPGVMGWWPVVLAPVKMLPERRASPTRTYKVEGKNYAIFLDRSKSQLAGVYVNAADGKTTGQLGVTVCTYTRKFGGGGFYPEKTSDLVLSDKRSVTFRPGSKPMGDLDIGMSLKNGKHTSSKDMYSIPYTVVILSPSYYTSSQSYKLTYTVGGMLK